jgi:hypothetical protein
LRPGNHTWTGAGRDLRRRAAFERADRTAGKLLGTTMSTGSGQRCTAISVTVLLA